MPESKPPDGDLKPNTLLAAFGSLMVLVALAGFFLEINSAFAGTILTLGVVLLLFAVLAPRMVGDQIVFGVFRFRLSPEGRRGIEEGEREVLEGEVESLDDIGDAVKVDFPLSESESRDLK
ncbi:hypothetical protein [Kitasatospora sp. Ki12]